MAAGRPRPERTVAQGLASLGWVDARTGRPLDELDAFRVVRDTTWTVVDRLGVLGARRTGDEVPTPSAVALARAALLHEEPPAPARTVPAIELTVTLRDVDPPVWRRLAVPAQASLHDLTGLLQAGMGWRGGHLSMVEVDGRSYGDVEDMDEPAEPPLPPVRHSSSVVGSRRVARCDAATTLRVLLICMHAGVHDHP